jgi:hypothetical protein
VPWWILLIQMYHMYHIKLRYCFLHEQRMETLGCRSLRGWIVDITCCSASIEPDRSDGRSQKHNPVDHELLGEDSWSHNVSEKRGRCVVQFPRNCMQARTFRGSYGVSKMIAGGEQTEREEWALSIVVNSNRESIRHLSWWSDMRLEILP